LGLWATIGPSFKEVRISQWIIRVILVLPLMVNIPVSLTSREPAMGIDIMKIFYQLSKIKPCKYLARMALIFMEAILLREFLMFLLLLIL
jgi:hypothetical protein